MVYITFKVVMCGTSHVPNMNALPQENDPNKMAEGTKETNY